MSTVKSKNLQVGTDATASNNFTIYQPSTPDGTLRIGVGNADSPTEVAQVTSNGLSVTGRIQTSAQPAFEMYCSTAQSQPANTVITIQFDSIQFDIGSNCNTSTYRFTAPVAGRYLIYLTVDEQTSGGCHSNIIVNGNQLTDGWVNFKDAGASVQTRLLNLSAGDYITGWAYNTVATSLSSNRCKLGGFLIG